MTSEFGTTAIKQHEISFQTQKLTQTADVVRNRRPSAINYPTQVRSKDSFVRGLSFDSCTLVVTRNSDEIPQKNPP